MFGIGFTEFIVIAIVAIVFLGPDKLPELGQKLGQFLRSYRNFKFDVTNRMYDTPPSKKKDEPDEKK